MKHKDVITSVFVICTILIIIAFLGVSDRDNKVSEFQRCVQYNLSQDKITDTDMARCDGLQGDPEIGSVFTMTPEKCRREALEDGMDGMDSEDCDEWLSNVE